MRDFEEEVWSSSLSIRLAGSMSVYEHLSNLGMKDIRLLRVTFGDASSAERPQYSLVVTPLFEAPEYAALSYAWDHSGSSEEIECNEHKLTVNLNVLAALASIRDLGSTNHCHFVWIDAICIDQSNRQERSAQVSIMKEIYTHAHVVYIWFGKDTQEIDRAVELMKKLDNVALLRRNQPGLSATEIAERAALPPVKSGDAWDDLYRLFFDRRWFERMWTIQELCHARKCMILNGGSTIDWEDLATVAPIFSFYQYTVPKRSQLFTVSSFSRIKSYHSLDRPRPLLDLLQVFRGQLATDPRDKVYAVLNLSTSPAVSSIPLDYTLSTAQVYTNAAQALISSDIPRAWNLDVLSAVHPFQTPGRPSWVPDWSMRLTTLAGLDGGPYKAYHTADNTVAEVSISPDQVQLLVKGFRIDDVTVVALPMVFDPGFIPRNSILSNPSAQHVLATWIRLACGIEKYPIPMDIDEALCETLVAGKGFNNTYPIDDDEYKTFYGSYIDLREKLDDLYNYGRFCDLERQKRYDDLSLKEPMHYLRRLETVSYFRTFIVTQKGYIGLAPYTTKRDDVICIFLGAQTPFLLRRTGDGWMLVGECYIHGIMSGQAFDKHDGQYENFRIR